MLDEQPLYLSWREPEKGDWHVVGLLDKAPDGFIFKYTKGSKKSANFMPFSGMESLEKSYISSELFPLFKNRILSPKRPEYPDFIQWIGLKDGQDASPLDILARSGGSRSTDDLQTFRRMVLNEDGKIESYFFVHGLRHLSKSTQEKVSLLTTGQELMLCLDIQNKHDSKAIIVRADQPNEILGFCPRYLSQELHEALRQNPRSIKAFVEKLDTDAPYHYRLMCKLDGTIDSLGHDDIFDEFTPIS